MAFNQPVEADRVDDSGFFSVFVRAPVVGTLLWILGGEEGEGEGHGGPMKDREDDLLERSGSSESEPKPTDSIPQSSPPNDVPAPQRKHKKDTMRSRPHMIGSDLSEIGELLNSDDGAFDDYHRGRQPRKEQDALHTFPRNNRKTMSWSDESGQDLVSYLDEVSYLGWIPFVSAAGTE